jgi:CRISPR-associated endonuclease Cas2
MSKKDFTLSSKILMSMLMAGDAFLVSPHELKKRLWKGEPLGDGKSVYPIVWYLANKGFIKYVDKNNERFVKLTKKGQLEALLAKARTPEKVANWDGKWRVIIFDIPEESEQKRHFFRYLLKQNGFVKLQHSVYINPYPLNREAITYLNKTGLNDYIRIMKVEEMDNDKDLKKKFNLV